MKEEYYRDDFLKRVELQWPEKDKIDMADFIIHNNGSMDKLNQEARTFIINYSNLFSYAVAYLKLLLLL